MPQTEGSNPSCAYDFLQALTSENLNLSRVASPEFRQVEQIGR